VRQRNAMVRGDSGDVKRSLARAAHLNSYTRPE